MIELAKAQGYKDLASYRAAVNAGPRVEAEERGADCRRLQDAH